MAGLLTPEEVLAQEIQRMEDRKLSLSIAVKAAEGELKELREQIRLEKIRVQQEIAGIQAKLDRDKAELAAQVDPLKTTVANLKRQADAEADRSKTVLRKHDGMLAEKRAVLDGLDKQLRQKQASLQSVSAELLKLKERVAAL